MSFLPTVSQNSSPTQNKSPLNKKRRFVPNSLPTAQTSLASSLVGNGFNSPMFVHVYGQRPAESDVQTQLFQVGMRIRKSVNEGYQVTPKRQMPIQPTSRYITGTTGLQSFAEPSFALTTPERSWKYSTANKRAFARETDDDSDGSDFSPMTPIMFQSDHKVQIPPDYFDINFDFDGMDEDEDSLMVPEDSPSQKGVLRTRVNGRRIAIPTSRRGKRKIYSHGRDIFGEFNEMKQTQQCNGRHHSRGTQWLGHERIALERRNHQGSDFEEADFLQERESVEMDCS